ncbi:MAG: serine hydrolase [Desulfobacteraceae bacterium]|nr:serine hydrolase [Desulfobacteraceae bacterium]
MKRWQTFRLVTTLISIMLLLSLASACASSTPKETPPAQVAAPAAPTAPAKSLTPAAPEELGFSPERLSRIDAAIKADVEKKAYDGAVLIIARKGKVAYFKSFGKRNPEKDLPMTDDAIFRVHSMTKSVTAVAVMQLMEEGKLLLSDPVFKYLPAFRDVQVGEIKTSADGKEELTLRPPKRHMNILDLLCHTSGLSYWFMAPKLIQAEYNKAGMRNLSDLTSKEVADKIASLPLVADPGTQYNYSVSYDVLGCIVEVISGQTLDQYVAERIAKPLGMKDSGFLVPPDAADRLVFMPPTSPFLTPVLATEIKFAGGGGGMVGTAMDFARFGQMLLNGGELDGVRVLSPATVQLMTADSLGELGRRTDSQYQPGPGHGGGFDFYVRRDAGGAYGLGSVGEFYKQGIAGTIYWVDPKQELVAAFMVNNPGAREYCRWQIKNLIYQAIVQ